MMILTACGSPEKQKIVEITSSSPGFWNHYFVYPLSFLIKWVANIPFIGYGMSIVIVTILVRFAMLPLMVKQMKSSKAMQALQPELNKLKEKYSSKDQATQMKMQQEQMALFKENGVNPLSGCLPLFIQMPILIAFYQAISRTSEIAQHNFLWFDLGNPDPFYILPIVAAITTFLQQKITMIGQDNSSPMAQQMAMMTYIMPIMILMFAINFPAALSLYWVVGNIFMIVQTYFVKAPEIKAANAKKAGGKK
jgi:YidC/Oxa1 family membrane protein insertase